MCHSVRLVRVDVLGRGRAESLQRHGQRRWIRAVCERCERRVHLAQLHHC